VSSPGDDSYRTRLLSMVRRPNRARNAFVRRYLALPFVRRRAARRARSALCDGTVLFVCFGNICRSPFAEHFLRRRFRRESHVMSAGYFPEDGRSSPPLALEVARRWNVDLASHRSRILNRELVLQADAIFVFDEENYRAVVAAHPSAKRRVHFIGALTETGPLFVPDPFGGTAAGFEEVYRQIVEALNSCGAPSPRRGPESQSSWSRSPTDA
jgi:protein-tyrosine phosphatase